MRQRVLFEGGQPGNKTPPTDSYRRNVDASGNGFFFSLFVRPFSTRSDHISAACASRFEQTRFWLHFFKKTGCMILTAQTHTRPHEKKKKAINRHKESHHHINSAATQSG